jgi:dipeptidyl aminopeptidase/acylaminoacyl peptidase
VSCNPVLGETIARATPFSNKHSRSPSGARTRPVGRIFRTIANSSLIGLASIVLVSEAAAATQARPAVEQFFQNPRFVDAQISPDGHTVAFAMAASKGARVRLLTLDLRTMTPSVVVASDTADIESFQWVNDKRLVYTLTDRQVAFGDLHEAPGLFAIDSDGSRSRQLVERRYPRMIRSGDVEQLLPWNTWLLHGARETAAGEVYVVKAEKFDRKHIDFVQLQRLNTQNGRVRDVPAPKHAFNWVIDAKGEPRIAMSIEGSRVSVMLRDPATDQWSVLAEFDEFDEAKAFTPRYIDETGRLFVTAAGGGDTKSVYLYDTAKHELSSEPFVRAGRYDLSPQFIEVHGKLVGLRYDADAQVTQWLDPALEALQARIDKLLPTTVNRISLASDGDGSFVLVRAASDRVPGRFFVFNVQEGKLTAIGDSHPDIDPRQMSKMEVTSYKARDGLEIPAYLTVPRGVERKGLPLIVLVHGGPWVRGQAWRWDPQVQFLASRGYAVLEPEFRGSTGYGTRLFRAGWKQWGLAMQDDVADGVKWAVSQGIVDPSRVCIAGASYGGYAVLMGLVNDPAVYRCGVEWVGVTDINLMYSVDWSDTSDDWKRYGMPRLIGDQVADAKQLKATSPIENVARIQAPLLLAYGGKDVRVPIIHGETFRDAMAKVPGSKVEGIVYDKEQHGWRKEANLVDFWTRVEQFLATQLAPR